MGGLGKYNDGLHHDTRKPRAFSQRLTVYWRYVRNFLVSRWLFPDDAALQTLSKDLVAILHVAARVHRADHVAMGVDTEFDRIARTGNRGPLKLKLAMRMRALRRLTARTGR